MKQTIHIAVDAAELIDSLQWDVIRKEITRDGARGMAGNDGLLTLRINGHPALHLKVREDDHGKVVVVLYNHHEQEVGRVYPEDEGFLPGRIVKPRSG